ncbi:hypothetical protein ACJX0J_033222, partial [Zea mays]
MYSAHFIGQETCALMLSADASTYTIFGPTQKIISKNSCDNITLPLKRMLILSLKGMSLFVHVILNKMEDLFNLDIREAISNAELLLGISLLHSTTSGLPLHPFIYSDFTEDKNHWIQNSAILANLPHSLSKDLKTTAFVAQICYIVAAYPIDTCIFKYNFHTKIANLMIKKTGFIKTISWEVLIRRATEAFRKKNFFFVFCFLS